MNLCFVKGKIISNVKFEFIINNKNISVVIFELKLNNNSIIKIKGFNEIADFCYQKLNKEDIVSIYGIINSNMEILIEEIYLL